MEIRVVLLAGTFALAACAGPHVPPTTAPPEVPATDLVQDATEGTETVTFADIAPATIVLEPPSPWTCDSAQVQELLRLITDPSVQDREGAADELGKFGEDCVVEPLLEALGDERYDVRWSAVVALGLIADPAHSGDLADVLLQDTDADVRVAAAEALGWMGGDTARDALIQALDDDASKVRVRAVRELGELGDPKAVKPLVGSLGDEDEAVVRESARALALLDAADALDALEKVKIDKLGRDAMEAVVLAVARIGGVQAMKYVEKVIAQGSAPGDPRSSVGIHALGLIDSPEARETLLIRLEDPDQALSRDASEALALQSDALDIKDVLDILETVPQQSSPSVIRLLGRMGDHGAVKPLTAKLAWGSQEERRVAATALGAIGDPLAVVPLVNVLGDSDIVLVERAVTALGRIGSTSATKALVALLSAVGPVLSSTAFNSAEHRLAMDIVDALGAIGDPAAADVVLQLVDEGLTPCAELHAGPKAGCQWSLLAARREFALTLGSLGDPRAVKPLSRWARDGDMWATLALGMLDAEGVLPVLAELVSSTDAATRAAASFALMMKGREDALPIFLDSFTCMDDGRIESLQAWLPTLVDDRIRETMVDVLAQGDRWNHRLGAALVLSMLPGPGPIEALIAALDDPDNRIRSLAANALRDLTGQSLGRDPKRWAQWWEKQKP